jgi:hypothetical protein
MFVEANLPTKVPDFSILRVETLNIEFVIVLLYDINQFYL